MERMEHSLSAVVDLLRKQGPVRKRHIDFGPIAVQLLTCVQAIHERKHVVVDIKPENFMIARANNTKESLASRVRILDLALVQPWQSIGSHRPNTGTKGIVGTPLYASINVHNLETPSRRDDLESLGYVIAELLMRLSSGNNDMKLPWSDGKSDEDIGKLKEEFVVDAKSSFYKQLGDESVVKVFREYIEEVRSYSYKKTPDYEELSKVLMELRVPILTPLKNSKATRQTKIKRETAGQAKAKQKMSAGEVAAKQTTSSTASATKRKATTGTKRVTRSQTRDDEEDTTSPTKFQKDESYMETEVVIVDSEEEEEEEESYPNAQPQFADDDSFATAEMDWGTTLDENKEPVTDSKQAARVGVTVAVEAGPHKGQTIHLLKGSAESYVVGGNPKKSKSADNLLRLNKDSEIDDSHIRLELSVSKKLISVNATDLNSSNGTFVGNTEKIRKGKDYRLFRGGSLKIGNSVLVIKQLEPLSSTDEPIRTKASSKANFSTNQVLMRRGQDRDEKKPTKATPSEQKENDIPRLKRRGVQLVVTEGPHAGDSFELEHGGVETFLLGSKPSGSVGGVICLKKDKTLKASHVRLDLVVSRKLTVVSVSDKSKGATYVNRSAVSNGRAFINDQIKVGNTVLEIRPL